MDDTAVVTVERFFLGQEREHPHATGEFTRLLIDIALVGKVIAGYVMHGSSTVLAYSGCGTYQSNNCED